MSSTDTQNISAAASVPTQATALQDGAPARAAADAAGPLPQARDFLTKVLPCPDNGYLNIHTKQADRKGLPGRGFTDIDAALGYIDWQKREGRDVYVCMSLQREAMPRKDKLGREYFTACRHSKAAVALKALFLELDCKFYNDDHRQTLAAFQEWRKKVGLPEPTVVVNSGNGLHVYFTLDRALPRDQWSILAHALEEAGKRHGLKFDKGVNSDASRVLRVPETLNFKSDPPKEVKLFWLNQQVDYKVEDMENILGAYAVDVPKQVSLSDVLEDPPLEAPRVPVTSELAAGIFIDSVMPQDEIRQCLDKIPNPGSNGWTEWNHMGMVLWVCSDGQDYGLEEWERWSRKHPSYGIDENDSCAARWKAYEGSPPTNLTGGSLIYMVRQALGEPTWTPRAARAAVSAGAIVDAFDASDPLDFVRTTTEDAVDRINHEYFFRRDTSEICRQDAVTGDIQVLSSQQLKTALAGRWVEAVDPKTDKQKVREAATVWLESRRRREVHGVQYCPNNVGLLQQCLNLWLGWGIEPAPSDCSTVLDHIRHVVAGGGQQKAEFILNWCADILQNPTRKPGVALVLRGREGTGKSVLGAILRRLLGERNVVVNADKDRLLGRFNSALASKILIQAEETFFAGDARTADALKHLITGQTLEIEVKFGRNFEINSFHRLLITSNHAQVIQASSEARRFVVCDVSDARRGDADYFDRLYAVADGRDDATAQAFMQHLLDRDLSGFRPWAAQQQFLGDDALVQQKALSLTPPLAWLREILAAVDAEVSPEQGRGWVNGKPVGTKWPTKFPRSEALHAFREWASLAKPHGASAYTGSEQRFWSEITRVIPRALTMVKDSQGNRCVAVSLDDARCYLQRYMQGADR